MAGVITAGCSSGGGSSDGTGGHVGTGGMSTGGSSTGGTTTTGGPPGSGGTLGSGGGGVGSGGAAGSPAATGGAGPAGNGGQGDKAGAGGNTGGSGGIGGSNATGGAGPGGAGGAPANTGPFVCNQAMPLTLTRQWFEGGFEKDAGIVNARWQLKAREHGYITEWANPNSDFWNEPIESPCTNGSTNPDHIVLMVLSWTCCTTAAEWETQINLAIGNLKTRYPALKRLDLMTMIRGPGNKAVPPRPTPVRRLSSPLLSTRRWPIWRRRTPASSSWLRSGKQRMSGVHAAAGQTTQPPEARPTP